MHGQTPELTDEVGIRTTLQDDGGRAHDLSLLVVLGHQHQGVVGIDEFLQKRFFVEFGIRIVLAVGGLEDLSDPRGVALASRPNLDHETTLPPFSNMTPPLFLGSDLKE